MKNRILIEESTLILSLFKWTFIGTLTGSTVGLAVTFFLKLIKTSEHMFVQYHLYWLLPIGLFLSSLVIKYLSPDAIGHGTEKVIEAIHHNSGRIAISVIPVKLIATLTTIVVGGSVGKEGPSAQIGAGISSLIADFLILSDQDRKKVVVCGISAGFAVVFGAPISGAIFGVEVLFMGHIMYDTLFPSFISGLVAYHTADYFGLEHYEYSTLLTTTSSFFWVKVIFAGLLIGLMGMLFIEFFTYVENLFEKLKIWTPYKGIIGGLIILPLSLILSKEYLGVGIAPIEAALRGDAVPVLGPLWKILYTSVSLASGGSGGILTPIFFIGAYTGNIFGHLFNGDPATFAAIGIISILASCANTPIAAIVMAGELFSSSISAPAALGAVVAFLVIGYRSAYPSQILLSIKTPTLSIKLGHEIKYSDDISYTPRKHTVSWQIIRIFKKIKRVIYKTDEQIPPKTQ